MWHHWQFIGYLISVSCGIIDNSLVTSGTIISVSCDIIDNSLITSGTIISVLCDIIDNSLITSGTIISVSCGIIDNSLITSGTLIFIVSILLAFLRHLYAKLLQNFRFYPRFWSKKRKYVPKMHCALMYFYSELMFLICTNVNLLYFCIAGFSSASICQNTTKWPFCPRFWSKNGKYWPELEWKLVINYFPRIFNPSN